MTMPSITPSRPPKTRFSAASSALTIPPLHSAKPGAFSKDSPNQHHPNKYYMGQRQLRQVTFQELQSYLGKADRGINLLPDALTQQIVSRALERRSEEGVSALPAHVYVIQELAKLPGPEVQALVPRFLRQLQNAVFHQVSRFKKVKALGKPEQPLLQAGYYERLAPKMEASRLDVTL